MEIGASGSDFRDLGQSWLELHIVNCVGRPEVGIIDNDEFSLFSHYKQWRLEPPDRILEVSAKVGYSSIVPYREGRLEVGIIDNDELSLFSRHQPRRLELLHRILEVSARVGFSSIMPTVDSRWALSIATSSL